MRLAGSGLAAIIGMVLGIAGSAQAVSWDQVYAGNVMPDAATPPWAHANAGGNSTLLTESLTDFLRLSNFNGTAYVQNSWQLANDPFMAGVSTAYEGDDPVDSQPGVWTRFYGMGSTVEWRMRIAAHSGITIADKVGVKLQIPGYSSTNGRAVLEMYYEGAPNNRVRNNGYTWGTHQGLTGNEGSESAVNDGFPGIGLNEWHTYKVTCTKPRPTDSAHPTFKWHRELWLDGTYVGRWTNVSEISVASNTSTLIEMRANSASTTECMVDFDYVRWADEPDGKFVRPVSPPTSQTLLLNQSFDSLPGPGQGWLGYYADNSAAQPTPPTMDGSRRWGRGRSETGTESLKTWQTVAVAVGDTVAFSGYLNAGAQGNATASIAVTLYDGPTADGTVIAAQTVDQATPRTNGDWVQVGLGGVAGSGYVTVAITTDFTIPNGPAGDVAAAYADGFSLTASSSCTAQHTLTSITPGTSPHNANTVGAVLSGTNLDRVTAVKLVQIPPNPADPAQVTDPVILPGTITTATPQVLTVDFPTDGENPGKYNVVAEAPDCLTQQIVNGFEIQVLCTNPSRFTGLSPASAPAPQSMVYLTLTGDNLDALTGVSLQQPGSITVIEGTFDPATLVASFDLTGRPTGFYNLVGTRTDTHCKPADLIAAFELVAPGIQAVVNGGFETGSIAPWTGGGCLTNNLPFAGAGPHSGSWFLGIAANGSTADCSAEQSIGLPNGPGEYDTMTLSFWAWVADGGGSASSVTGEILVDGTSVAQTTWSSDTPGMTQSRYTYMTTSWSGTVTTDIAVKITERADGTQGGANNWPWGIVTADDVKLAGTFLRCNNPYADADGDGDVDQLDFAVLQSCVTSNGGGIPSSPEYCRCFDRPEGDPPTRDGDIDQADVTAFENCASGPGIPANTACDGTP
jgi:hypothetical protein